MRLNKKTVLIFITSILMISFGVTYALTSSGMVFNTTSSNISINYDDGSNGIINLSGINLYPILDNTVDTNTTNVIKINFTVSGKSTNPSNLIYDISLKNLEVDNNLLSKYVKWKLKKNNTIISEGSLSPDFDTINNGRLVLTNIQQDLTTTTDSYQFILWLSDACQESDITKCIDPENQDYLYNKNISGKIEVEVYKGNKKMLVRSPAPYLYNTIKEGAVMDNIQSTYVSSSSGINFASISSDTNGKGIYERNGTQNDTYPIYYYRGAVDNNNVLFAGFCWKIVRTTETGGIKIIYNGTPTSGTCDNTGDATQISTKKFNTYSNSLSDVGYMYGARYVYSSKSMSSITDTYYYGNTVTYANGTYTLSNTTTSNSWSSIYNGGLNNYHYTCFSTSNKCTSVYYIYYTSSSTAYYITLTGGKKVETAISEMLDNNTNHSTIKGNTNTSVDTTTVDGWYYTNIDQTGKSSYIEDTIYCNDRSINTYGGWNPNGGSTISKTSYLYFGAYGRSTNPIVTCPRDIDKFTVSSSNGNGNLTYPVGLLTEDEARLAGGHSSTNQTYYLYTGNAWWLASPHYFNANIANWWYVTSTGILSINRLSSPSGVRPVVSLVPGTRKYDGDGTSGNPYVVELQ